MRAGTCAWVAMASLLITSCATTTTPAGERVSSSAYNAEISAQGLRHYCGSGRCDTPPTLVRVSAPRYPSRELQEGIEGSASVIFDIDTTGQVINARIESATTPAFGEAALETVSDWKYRPAMLDGKPVAMKSLRQLFPFQLGN